MVFLFHQASYLLVSQVRPKQLPSTCIQIHYSLIISTTGPRIVLATASDIKLANKQIGVHFVSVLFFFLVVHCNVLYLTWNFRKTQKEHPLHLKIDFVSLYWLTSATPDL